MFRTVLLAAAVLVLAALVLLQIRRAPETYPWGDTATTSIYALRAAHGDLATGAYSRFRWNHPGPLLYQTLAPLYRLTGYREISLKWTMLALNVGALSALLFVVWRRAPALAVTIALALIPLLYREQRLLFWAWNPIAPLLTLALSISLAAGVAAGELTLLPWFVAAASFVLQAHVGFAPVLAAIAAVTGGLLKGRVKREPLSTSRVTIRRAIVWSCVVFAILWAVPVVHEVRVWPGNLSHLASFFLGGVAEPQPWRAVRGVFANQFLGPLHPAWALTTDAASESASMFVTCAVVAEAALLLAVAVCASRRRAFHEAAFSALCLAASVAGLFAIRSITGPISDYLVTWIAVVGALGLAAIAAEALHLLGRRTITQQSPMWSRALIGYIVVVACVGSLRLVSKHAADARSVVVRSFAESLERYCEAQGIDRPLLGFSPAAWEMATGTVLQFYKQDRPIAVTEDGLYLVGEPFSASGREAGEFYLMMQNEAALPSGVTRHEWLTTQGEVRLVRVFRDAAR